MRSAWFALGAAAALAGCGGGGGGGGGTGSCTPVQTRTVTITATGLQPQAVCVTPGGTVTFTNSDMAQHDVEPVSGCLALSVGTLAPNESKPATFASAQTCTFQVADEPGNSAFQGTVAVSQTTTTGPGY